MSFSLTQAAQGHEFVVAASHFIFLRRQPSHARITASKSASSLLHGLYELGTFESFVSVVFVDEDILLCVGRRRRRWMLHHGPVDSEIPVVERGGCMGRERLQRPSCLKQLLMRDVLCAASTKNGHADAVGSSSPFLCATCYLATHAALAGSVAKSTFCGGVYVATHRC